MQFHVHHHAVPDRQTQQRLDLLLTLLETVIANQEKIMATLDEVLAAVNDESTQEDSIVALLQQLREQIAGLTSGTLPPDVQAKVDAIFTGLQSNKAKLAAAVANTGSNPAPASSAPSSPDSFSTVTGQEPPPPA